MPCQGIQKYFGGTIQMMKNIRFIQLWVFLLSCMNWFLVCHWMYVFVSCLGWVKLEVSAKQSWKAHLAGWTGAGCAVFSKNWSSPKVLPLGLVFSLLLLSKHWKTALPFQSHWKFSAVLRGVLFSVSQLSQISLLPCSILEVCLEGIPMCWFLFCI